jgi:Type VI secretion system/phage-baseplate injector OB domain
MMDDRNRPQRFVGKYRGKVIENVDPLFQGRIIADVPSVSGSLLNWALPCTPYAGLDVGFYAIPPIGANVWVEFEGGDPNYPVWVGCFWGPEDILHVPEPPPPETKVFKTEFITMILNDLPEVGGFTLKCLPPAVDVPLTMTFDSTGITILCPESTIKMTPETITLTVPESVIEMTAETITVTVPASSATMTGEAIEVESPEISITGETNITGALSVEGETNIVPELTVEGDTNIAGALTVEGATEIAGALAVEGAVNIAGGIAIEGGGVIDGAPIL